ncbi:rcc01693 family protein [Methylobrevis albus]|nr:rcc01693 family protein [Methylobrevis albus]
MTGAPVAAAAFPWDEAMRLGFGVLRLGPAAFWAMTPRELAAAAGRQRPAGPGRDVLATLMAAYPDHAG